MYKTLNRKEESKLSLGRKTAYEQKRAQYGQCLKHRAYDSMNSRECNIPPLENVCVDQCGCIRNPRKRSESGCPLSETKCFGCCEGSVVYNKLVRSTGKTTARARVGRTGPNTKVFVVAVVETKRGDGLGFY